MGKILPFKLNSAMLILKLRDKQFSICNSQIFVISSFTIKAEKITLASKVSKLSFNLKSAVCIQAFKMVTR